MGGVRAGPLAARGYDATRYAHAGIAPYPETALDFLSIHPPPDARPPPSTPSYLIKYFNEALLEGIEMFPGFPVAPNSMSQKQVRRPNGATLTRCGGLSASDPVACAACAVPGRR